MAMISKFSAFIIILGCFAFALFVLLHHSAIRLEGESVISGYGKDRHLSKSSIYQQQLDKQANEIQSLIATTQKLLVDIKASNISLSQELLSDINNILAADRRGKEDLHSQYNACRHEAETCDAKFTQLSNRCNAANPNPNPNSKLNSPNPPTLILPNQQQHVPLLPPSRHESATTVSDTNPTRCATRDSFYLYVNTVPSSHSESYSYSQISPLPSLDTYSHLSPLPSQNT